MCSWASRREEKSSLQPPQWSHMEEEARTLELSRLDTVL